MYLIILLLALAVSMDAFSLSLIYGVMINSKKKKFILAIMVGIFHFFMPLLGNIVGTKIFTIISLSNKIIAFFLFMILGLNMVLEKETVNVDKFSIKEFLIFPLAVSMDSFSIGIGLYKGNNMFL